MRRVQGRDGQGEMFLPGELAPFVSALRSQLESYLEDIGAGGTLAGRLPANGAALAWLAACAGRARTQAARARPNVLFIMTDDHAQGVQRRPDVAQRLRLPAVLEGQRAPGETPLEQLEVGERRYRLARAVPRSLEEVK